MVRLLKVKLKKPSDLQTEIKDGTEKNLQITSATATAICTKSKQTTELKIKETKNSIPAQITQFCPNTDFRQESTPSLCSASTREADTRENEVDIIWSRNKQSWWSILPAT